MLTIHDTPWPADRREAAQSLWGFHQALYRPRVPPHATGDFAAEEAQRVASGMPLRVMPEDTSAAAIAACTAFGIPRELLTTQVATVLQRVLPIDFETAAEMKRFAFGFAGAQARALMYLAGYGKERLWPFVDELAYGFFLTTRILNLPADLAEGRCYIPADDRAAYEVSRSDLRDGPRNAPIKAPVRRLLWKQTIRARDALAQGQPLIDEVSRGYAKAMTRAWFGALEMLVEIERRDYDVWSSPITLSRRQRFQVWYQSRFGRTGLRQ